MDSIRKNPLLFAILLGPALLWLLLFFLLPLGAMFMLSVSEQTSLTETTLSWTSANYLKAFDWVYLKVILSSVWIAAITTAVCLVIGYPVAMAVAFAPPRLRPVLLLLVILPFWTNLLVRTYALKSVLGASGLVNTVLGYIGIGPLDMIYNTPSIIIGLVYVHLPFMVLPLYTALEKLDRSYLEASLDLGAGQVHTFFRIMVPLTMPAIVTGCIITFIPAFGALVTPALLGGPDNLMIGNLIEDLFKKANDWTFGSALSLLLVYITFVILALQSWLASRQSQREVTR